MNAFYSLLLVAVSFSLGAVYGETRAPISGITVQALAIRVAALEQRLGGLSLKYEALSDLLRSSPDADGGR